MSSYADDVEFTLKCRMRARWVPHFLGALKQMQYLGGIGSSRDVTLHADGDGDFRPKFEWPEGAVFAAPVFETNGKTHFDAG